MKIASQAVVACEAKKQTERLAWCLRGNYGLNRICFRFCTRGGGDSSDDAVT
jgi:hypothetical protein